MSMSREQVGLTFRSRIVIYVWLKFANLFILPFNFRYFHRLLMFHINILLIFILKKSKLWCFILYLVLSLYCSLYGNRLSIFVIAWCDVAAREALYLLVYICQFMGLSSVLTQEHERDWSAHGGFLYLFPYLTVYLFVSSSRQKRDKTPKILFTQSPWAFLIEVFFFKKLPWGLKKWTR